MCAVLYPMASCKLDGMFLDDSDHSARDSLARSLGVTEAQADGMLADLKRQARAGLAKARAASAALVGDLTQCSAVRTNRALIGVHIVVQVAVLGVLGVMLLRKGAVPWHYAALRVVGLVGVAIAALRARHSISLAAKVAWHGSTKDVRRMLVLGAMSAVTSVLLFGLRRPPRPRVVVPILLMLALLTGIKVYTLGSTLADKTAGASIAYLALLDRVLTAKRIEAASNLLRG